VIFADWWPSIRDNANTFTPELIEIDAHVWHRPCGVIVCTLARRPRPGTIWSMTSARQIRCVVAEDQIVGAAATARYRQLVEHELKPNFRPARCVRVPAAIGCWQLPGSLPDRRILARHRMRAFSTERSWRGIKALVVPVSVRWPSG
jgi:hypothetical protein